MPKGPRGEKRLSRVTRYWIAGIIAGAAAVGGFFVARAYPNNAWFELTCQALVLLGVSLMLIGQWRRRAKGP
jgi:hypothetical protein